MTENKKELLGVRVYNVALEYNIVQSTVHKIVGSFVGNCRNLLAGGYLVRLSDLVTISPSTVTEEYIPTLGYISKLVSFEQNIPYYTVFSIVSSYLDTVREEILSGRDADIRKLVSFHSIQTGTGEFKVHCYLSASVRSLLRATDGQTGARVSFSKSLKECIKRGVAQFDR